MKSVHVMSLHGASEAMHWKHERRRQLSVCSHAWHAGTATEVEAYQGCMARGERWHAGGAVGGASYGRRCHPLPQTPARPLLSDSSLHSTQA